MTNGRPRSPSTISSPNFAPSGRSEARRALQRSRVASAWTGVRSVSRRRLRRPRDRRCTTHFVTDALARTPHSSATSRSRGERARRGRTPCVIDARARTAHGRQRPPRWNLSPAPTRPRSKPRPSSRRTTPSRTRQTTTRRLRFGHSAGTCHAADGLAETFRALGLPNVAAVFAGTLITAIPDALVSGFVALCALLFVHARWRSERGAIPLLDQLCLLRRN